MSLIPGIEKFYASEGSVTIFCIFFCLPVPKTLVEEPFCDVFQEISGSKKFMDNSGGAPRVCVESFLSHSAKKLRRGTL